MAVLNGSKLENHGNITIDADNSYGIVIRGKKNADGTIHMLKLRTMEILKFVELEQQV